MGNRKPILKVTRVRQGTKYEGYYLSIVVKEHGTQRSIRSFGNANNPENWDAAIDLAIDLQLEWYSKFYEGKKRAFLEGSTPSSPNSDGEKE